MKRSIIFLSIFITAAVVFIACSKEYSLENGIYGTTAKGTLKSDSGDCMPITVHGTFYDGILPSIDTNQVQIEVNVVSAGSYNIKTDLQNGFQFADSGYFQNTGLNTVYLKPTGTPILQVVTTFTVSFDSTECTFNVTVEDSAGKNLGGNSGDTAVGIPINTWQFSENGHLYSGPIISALVQSSIGTQLTIAGEVQSGMDTTFGITAQSLTSTLDTGLYQTSQAGTNFGFESYPSGNIIFAANALNSPPILNIYIKGYDVVNAVVAGTFSGSAYDFNNNVVTITGGVFKANIQ
jgi:hypothetical protein